CPGRLWVSELPQNIMQYDNEHQLKFTPLLSGLYKNHGFCIHQGRKIQYAVVGSENGVYMVVPPNSGDSSWKCEHIFDKPVSDMLYRDFDHDGENELLVITPFHGENIQIYKSSNGKMLKIYERKKKMPFAHAIWGDTINGDEYAFIGGRNGDRELVSIHYDRDTEQYIEEVIDVGAGAANCMMYKVDGEKRLLVANRETDEVGIYEW
ncbi:MAG: hypothetical protein PHT21_13145, partial [Lachnospiraceae bacterium]|nr:hypothetical protein [Lachnospiraceae bacterium]